jgi:hypothetical protein
MYVRQVQNNSLAGDPTLLSSSERTWVQDIAVIVAASVVAHFVIEALKESKK